MKSIGTLEIYTNRLYLRRLRISDAQEHSRMLMDEDVTRYLRMSTHTSPQESLDFLTALQQRYEDNNFYRWAITYKDNTVKEIGTIGLIILNDNDDCADVAYFTAKEVWGTGVVTEALGGVIRFAFEEIGLNRIQAYHSVNNPASGRVMQKNGMKYEGYLRQQYKSKMGYEDCRNYAILKDDYMDERTK